ncbi:B12-binding domain-containing radical SAM protein [candidate division CSSED10-310 bacterium]|uniref:B12-binding domain-containing radical SAM protein n=1 Tax=candidate division CSSED10-310 bacterium TaxID=2855610 RepID=A0ABV6Z6E3_UNCC1
MRIGLFQTYLGRHEQPVYPLGLAFIGSVLHHHQREVLCRDLNIYQSPLQELEATIKSFQPEMIGLSLRNIDTTQSRDLYYYYLYFQEQIRKIKKIAPDIPLVVGGSGFSLYADQIMRDNPELDFGIYREGEETMQELSVKINTPQAVVGLYYRQNQTVCFTGSRPVLDLATLPPLKWDLFSLAAYKEVPGALGVETKRGCSLQCDYCTYPFLDGRNIRKHPVAHIMSSLEDLVFNHGFSRFTFTDSIFNIPQDHAHRYQCLVLFLNL